MEFLLVAVLIFLIYSGICIICLACTAEQDIDVIDLRWQKFLKARVKKFHDRGQPRKARARANAWDIAVTPFLLLASPLILAYSLTRRAQRGLRARRKRKAEQGHEGFVQFVRDFFGNK